jgi:hypothetical protein
MRGRPKEIRTRMRRIGIVIIILIIIIIILILIIIIIRIIIYLYSLVRGNARYIRSSKSYYDKNMDENVNNTRY